MKKNQTFFTRGQGGGIIENVTPRVDAGRHPVKRTEQDFNYYT